MTGAHLAFDKEVANTVSPRALSVVYFGNDWSAENRTSSHHIAERLSARMPLLYIDSPGMRSAKPTGRDLRKIVRKVAAAIGKPRPIGPQMWYISTPQIPFRKLPFVNSLNRVLSRFLVRRALRSVGFGDIISWFVVPHPGPLAGTLGEKLVVYYVTDAHSALPDVDAGEIKRMDEALTRRADQVFVVSPTLLDTKRKLNPNTTHAPHGVDVSLFGLASDPSCPVAQETVGLARPIIGFFGLIEAWIDLDLIGSLARSRPQWTFLMIGRLAVDPAPVKDLPNVIFAGPQPYRTLPQWARAFDVAIIPYRKTTQVFHANPLKLREYLATGKPIVSVSTPEIDLFSNYIRLANTPVEFLEAIEQALSSDSAEDRNRRMASVANMSWDARVDDVLAVVQRRLAEGPGHRESLSQHIEQY